MEEVRTDTQTRPLPDTLLSSSGGCVRCVGIQLWRGGRPAPVLSLSHSLTPSLPEAPMDHSVITIALRPLLGSIGGGNSIVHSPLHPHLHGRWLRWLHRLLLSPLHRGAPHSSLLLGWISLPAPAMVNLAAACAAGRGEREMA